MPKFLNISAKRIRLSTKSNKRPKEWERRRSGRLSVCENSKRRQLIDRLKSTLWEPRELSRRARDRPEKEKSSSRQRGWESKLTSKKLDKSNSLRRLLPLLSRLASKEKTTCTRSRSKSRSSCKRGRSKKIESKPSSNTLTRSDPRFRITKILRSKIDWTTWKREERLERKSIWRETRSRTSNKPKYRNSKTLE